MKKLSQLFVLTLFCFYTSSVLAERTRLALVIGNADYAVGQLHNPVNDVRLVASTLRSLGFQVTMLENASQEAMESAVNQFGQSLNQNTVGLFYFSGHGVQHDGQNYLVPIGAMGKISTAGQLRYKTVNAGFILDTMKQSGSGLNFFFLDACRNTPFKSFTRSMHSGLAKIDNAEGTLIAFATAPGKVAWDGNSNNSPYTSSLVKWMKKPNLAVEFMLKGVRADVKKQTNGKQSPWYEASIDGNFYFNVGSKDIVNESSLNNSNSFANISTPSFDCAKAKIASEYAICESDELSKLDKQMSDLYYSKYSILNARQKQWQQKRNQCGHSKHCLINIYQQRIHELSLKNVVDPSFDCSRASNLTENTICNSDELAKLDNQMVREFNQKNRTKWLIESQHRWLSSRDQCGRDVSCIKNAYIRRINSLKTSETYP